jgi:hypothetical protein
MAATNKCLAQSNKSDAGTKATKKRNQVHVLWPMIGDNDE